MSTAGSLVCKVVSKVGLVLVCNEDHGGEGRGEEGGNLQVLFVRKVVPLIFFSTELIAIEHYA